MIINSIPAENVMIAVGYTDMRLSIDGLSAIIKQVFKLEPCSRNLYIFCGRRNDRIKALWWEGDGFALVYKRLEYGRFQWPRNASEVRTITPQQLRWLLEGLSMEQPKAVRKVDKLLVV